MSTQALLFSPVESLAPPAMPTAPPVAALNGDGGGRNPMHIPIGDPGVDLASKTVCIKVRLSTMGNTRKV
jgi:hypothetical protein